MLNTLKTLPSGAYGESANSGVSTLALGNPHNGFLEFTEHENTNHILV